MNAPPEQRVHWPTIMAYALLGAGSQRARVELEPFVGATVVELLAPRDPALLWGMWNTVQRAVRTGGDAYLNAAITGRARPGQLSVQFDPLHGHQLVAIPLPPDPALRDTVREAVLAAMRIVTGQDEPKDAAAILRERATTAAKARQSQVNPSPSRTRNLQAEYEQAKAMIRHCERALELAKSGGSDAHVDACRKSLTAAHRAASTAKAAHEQVKAATEKLTARRKSTKKSASKQRRSAAKGSRTLPESRVDSRHDRIPDIDAGVRLTQDPDADSKSVWVLKSGHSFHRRDCHVIYARDGASRLPIASARRRNLEPCMHCAPTVR